MYWPPTAQSLSHAISGRAVRRRDAISQKLTRTRNPDAAALIGASSSAGGAARECLQKGSAQAITFVAMRRMSRHFTGALIDETMP
jgi:hypothetical protein